MISWTSRYPSVRRTSLSAALSILTAGLLGLTGPAPATAQPADPQVISLHSGVIDPRRPPTVTESLRLAPGDEAGSSYVLVKFAAPVSERQLRALASTVEKIYAYLPSYAFLVRVAPQRRAELAALGAAWSGPYQPQYKLAPAFTALAEGSALRRSGDEVILLHVYPDADLDQVAERVRELGFAIAGRARGGLFSRLRLVAPTDRVTRLGVDLARIPEVFWLDRETRRGPLNDTTIWVGQSGVDGGQTTPVFDHGLHGEGQIVAVLDSGIEPDMCFFRDPARGLPPLNLCNQGTRVDRRQRKMIAVDFLWEEDCRDGIADHEWDDYFHGTHVAGVLAGDDFATPVEHDPGDGMAPAAQLVIQDAGLGSDACADFPGIGCPVVDLKPFFRQAYRQGARIHSNSWGDQEEAAVTNVYTAASQDADEFSWTHKDFLLFFAAGNSGPTPGSVVSPSTAKNVVSVGATRRGVLAEQMPGFSSCGPTDDGRIKPDVTLPGSMIVSAFTDFDLTTNNCDTVAASGTSLSTPGAAGLTALVRQYFTEGWYPAGRRRPGAGFTPSAALLRATLVSSARAMTAAAPIPDRCQGWGRILLDDALYFASEPRRLWVQDDARPFRRGAAGESRHYSFHVAAGQPLKVTLAWTDFPSTPAANPHLNNDLDLVVSGPGGTFRGNVFAGGVSAPDGAADRLNTLEQVLLADPAPGRYTVTVRAFNVPDGPQPFALVATGAF